MKFFKRISEEDDILDYDDEDDDDDEDEDENHDEDEDKNQDEDRNDADVDEMSRMSGKPDEADEEGVRNPLKLQIAQTAIWRTTELRDNLESKQSRTSMFAVVVLEGVDADEVHKTRLVWAVTLEYTPLARDCKERLTVRARRDVVVDQEAVKRDVKVVCRKERIHKEREKI